jgi:hypothetical protein
MPSWAFMGRAKKRTNPASPWYLKALIKSDQGGA